MKCSAVAWYIPNRSDLATLDSYLVSITELEANLGAAMVAHRRAGVAKSQSGADNVGAANRLLTELTGRP